MSKQFRGIDISLVAAADLSAKQFFAVKVDANGKAALAALGEPAIGVLQNNPGIDQAATVRYHGCTKMVASGVITAGDQVGVDANGRAVGITKGRTNTSDAGVAADPLLGGNCIGIALETSAALGTVIAVLLTHAGAVPTTLA